MLPYDYMFCEITILTLPIHITTFYMSTTHCCGQTEARKKSSVMSHFVAIVAAQSSLENMTGRKQCNVTVFAKMILEDVVEEGSVCEALIFIHEKNLVSHANIVFHPLYSLCSLVFVCWLYFVFMSQGTF